MVLGVGVGGLRGFWRRVAGRRRWQEGFDSGDNVDAVTATDILTSLGVSPETIADFCRRWRIVEFAVFGSAARGEMRPDSDVDVMVDFEPGQRPRGWGFIDMKLELESLFGLPVDLIDSAPIENPFRRHSIMRDRTVVYTA